jgi:hypothetical protein
VARLERFEVFYMNTEEKTSKQDLFTVDNEETWCSAPVFKRLVAGYEHTSPDNIEIHGWTKVDGP